MNIYAIGDLHLSASVNKPMDIFGDNWQGHSDRIAQNWKRLVEEQDVVLIPGDISWAMNLEQALADLEWIHQLPGQKILIKGNHDYWWQSVSKLNDLYQDMFFLQNTSYQVGGYSICGTRGWGCPGQVEMDEHNTKIYNREEQRLKLSLDHAMKSAPKEIIVMLHYPPTNDKKEPSLFTNLLEQYPVSHVVYAHLHGEKAFDNSLRGRHNGINYTLVSADALSFSPCKIIEAKGIGV